MIRIELKPLSVNQAWLGRRRKSQKYRDYAEVLLELLPDKLEIPKRGELFIFYRWGFSSTRSDTDNPIKPLQDVLQTKYGFNDSRITFLCAEKHLVKKGEDYFEFSLKSRGDIRIEIVDLNTQELIYEK